MKQFNYIDFISQAEAERSYYGKKTALISITCPEDKLVKFENEPFYYLRLQFHDCSKHTHGCPIINFATQEQTGYFKAFQKEDAESIISFLNSALILGAEALVVHCLMGISRSAAVAEFARKYYSNVEDLKRSTVNLNHHVLKTLKETWHESKQDNIN